MDVEVRPEGPSVNRLGREAGIKLTAESSAEGAAHQDRVPRLRCSFSLHSHPGLTAGAMHWRPFGPPDADRGVRSNRPLRATSV